MHLSSNRSRREQCVMVGLLTTREKFDCCVMLGISKEADFSIVNYPER